MIIDFHTHIFPDKIAERSIEFLSAKSGVKNKIDGTAAGLVKSMEDGGVDLSVVLPVATKPQQFDSITRFAAEINEKYDGKLLSLGGIHPLDTDYKQHLKTLKNAGFKGIKLHPDYQDIFIDDINCKRLIYEASALDMIIVVHAGEDIGYGDPVHCPPQKTLDMINEIHPEKLVLAHLGGWEQWDDVLELLCGLDIWLDTAFCFEYIKPEMFDKILKKHGHKRILFATDSPWSGQKDYVERIERLLPDKAVRDAVTCGNAKELLYGTRDQKCQ